MVPNEMINVLSPSELACECLEFAPKPFVHTGPSDSRVLEAEAAMLGLSEAGHFDLTLMLDLKVEHQAFPSQFSCPLKDST